MGKLNTCKYSKLKLIVWVCSIEQFFEFLFFYVSLSACFIFFYFFYRLRSIQQIFLNLVKVFQKLLYSTVIKLQQYSIKFKFKFKIFFLCYSVIFYKFLSLILSHSLNVQSNGESCFKYFLKLLLTVKFYNFLFIIKYPRNY